MNIRRLTLLVPFAILYAIGCKNDDENPTPANQAPGAVEITSDVKENSVTISWTPAEDPEGDAVKYTVLIESDTVAKNLRANTYLLSDLRYENEYSGKIIAKDTKGESGETDFSFTTGFLFLKSYERYGDEYFLEYDDGGKLVNIETPFSDHNTLVRNAKGMLISMGGISLSYNSGDLINKIDDGGGEGTIQYDSKNRIVRMAADYQHSASNKVRVVRNHTYNDQGQLIQVDEDSYRFSSGNSTYSRFQLQYDSKGNVVQTRWEYSYDNITFSLAETRTYTYDTHKNPWYTILSEQTGLSPINILASEGLNNTISLGSSVVYRTFWMSKNNIIKVRVDYNSGFSETENSYTYNEDNYPITVEKTTTSTDYPSSTNYERWYY